MKGIISAAAAFLCSVALPYQAPEGRATAQQLRPPPPGKLYHGVYPGGRSGEEDDITPGDVTSYEAAVGKRVAWVYFSNNWYRSPRFPREAARWIRDSGAVPFIRLMLRGENNSDGGYTLDRIIAGAHDAALREWAREAKAFGTPLIVEYGTEVNGQWFPWNGVHNGGGQRRGFADPSKPDGPERFVSAFRHIVGLMRTAGAHNVTWVFHVNATDWPDTNWNRLEEYYPGDSYVDWIGVSAYGPQKPTDEDWQSFREQMDPCYARITALAPAKPVVALEFGSTAGSPLVRPQAWAEAALDDLLGRRWPRIIGFSWWNERWQNDDKPAHDSNMRVQDTPALAAVFRAKLDAAKHKVQERPLLGNAGAVRPSDRSRPGPAGSAPRG